MLISDWSSDVCSSDLRKEVCGGNNFGCLQRLWRYGCRVVLVPVLAAADTFCGVSRVRRAGLPGASMTAPPAGALEACLALLEKATEGEWEDRTSVVSGKSVSVRVDLGCRVIIKK